jgi:arylsulfatase A-like enzyme
MALGTAGWILLRKPSPNVVLITIDTLRPDRLSCYGHDLPPTTPNIDRLASEGVLFLNAFCDVTWTTPSMSSVMTGTYATRHGLRSTFQQLDPANVTVAEELKRKGYRTAAIIGSFPLAASFGLNQGFDTYDDHFTAPIVIGGEAPSEPVPDRFANDADQQRFFQFLKAQADAYRPDDAVSDAAIAWLRAARASKSFLRKPPFFLWVHYFGPHELADVRLNFLQQNAKIIADYDGQVRHMDTEVGRLLDAMRELQFDENTLTILHADHGQSLNEHQYVGHGKNLFDPTLRIPLIVRLPQVIPGNVRVEARARNIDIMPTILEAAGITTSVALDGLSLRSILSNPNAPAQEMYCETYLGATDAFSEPVADGRGGKLRVGFRRLGILDGRWKFIVSEPWPLLDFEHPPEIPSEVVKRLRKEELYDVVADPTEVTAIDRADVAEALRAKIDSYNATEGHGGFRHDLDDAAKERLRSLGYLH